MLIYIQPKYQIHKIHTFDYQQLFKTEYTPSYTINKRKK